MLLDMLFGIEPKARVFAIDTHYLFPETYELWREVEQRYDTKVEVFEGPSAEQLAAKHGEELWEQQARPLSRDRQGRAARPGARRPRRLDHRRPPRPVADARQRAEARLGRRARAVEGEPARRLERRRLLGLHPRARAALQRAARPRLRVDRRHALDAPGRRPRGPLGRQRPHRVRPCTSKAETSHDASQCRRRTLSHLDELESEAIHIMREVAAERERPVLLFSGGKDSIVLLRLAEKAFRPGASSRSRSCTSTRATTSPRWSSTATAASPSSASASSSRACRSRSTRAACSRADRAARVAQPAADDDTARRDRGARLRRGDGRRAPRRGARPREGAHLQLPRRLRPVEPARAAARALEPLQRAHPQGRAHPRLPDLELDRARRVAVRRARAPRAAVDLLRARARGVQRDGMLYAASDFVERFPDEEPFTAIGPLPHGRRHDVHGRRASATPGRSRTSSTRSRRRASPSAARPAPTTASSEAAMEDRKRVGYF